MSGCESYEPRVSALLDGALEEPERRELEAHLASCPACRAYLEDLKTIQTAIRELDVPAPAGFAGRVMDKIQSEPQPAKRAKTIRLSHWRRWAAAAACCALVLAGLWTLRPGASSDPAPINLPSGGAAAPYDGAGDGLNTCSLDGGAATPRDAVPDASTQYAAVLTTDSEAARTWLEAELGLPWTAGERYTLTAEEYASLRQALAEAGAGFTEEPGAETSEIYLLVAE